jgi:SAM-dependent methyltransferase
MSSGAAMSILLSALFLLIMLFLMSTIWTNSRGAPWVPTPREVVRRMLSMAEVQPGEVVYDLGCGDGRVLVTAARRFGARAVGIEIDVSRFLWSLAAITACGLWGRVRLIRGDLFRQDLREADVVMTYLLQDTNDRLQAKLLRQLRPGARVVSNTFNFSGLRLAAVDEEYKLYLYRIEPAGR